MTDDVCDGVIQHVDLYIFGKREKWRRIRWRTRCLLVCPAIKGSEVEMRTSGVRVSGEDVIDRERTLLCTPALAIVCWDTGVRTEHDGGE